MKTAAAILILVCATSASAQPNNDQKMCVLALQQKQRMVTDQTKLRGVPTVDQTKLEANLAELNSEIAALKSKCGG